MEKLIFDRIYIRNDSGSDIFDLKLYDWYTLICGKSGIGKSLLYQCIEKECKASESEYAYEREKYSDKDILLINFSSTNVIESIAKAKEKLIIVDNYDYLLNKVEKLDITIRSDISNQYILIGRNFETLGVSGHCLADLVKVNGVQKLDYSW